MDIFSFQGRAVRLEFWLVSIGLTVVMILFSVFAGFIIGSLASGLSAYAQGWARLAFGLAVALMFIWPIMAVAVRRAHDRGASGRWFVVFQLLMVAANTWSMSLGIRGVDLESIEALLADLAVLAFFAWWIYFIVTLGFLPGNKGANQYGPHPGAGISNYRSPTA